MATQTTNLGLIKPGLTDKIRIVQINGNMDILDNVIGPVGNTSLQTQMSNAQSSVSALQDGLAIVSNNNAHPAIAQGQYVYVKNHGSLDEGLYVATTAIAANGTLSASNLTADSGGGLNTLSATLSEQIEDLQGCYVYSANTDRTVESNRTTAMEYVFNNGFKNGYKFAVVSYASGYRYSYVYIGAFDTRRFYVIEFSESTNPPITSWVRSDGSWGKLGEAASQSGDGLKNGNIDNYKDRLVCWIQRDNSSGTQPGSMRYYTLEVIPNGNGQVVQRATELSSGNTATRLFANSAWSPWALTVTNDVATNTSFSSEGIRAYKFGRVVMVTFETYTATSAHAVDTTIATLPAGWRPIMQVSFVDSLSPDRRVVIQSGTGYIQAKKAIANGESVRGYATFISDS